MIANRPSRRRFLRGAGLAGLAIALPALESLGRRPKVAQAAELPENFVIFHWPNGVYMPDWLPDMVGPNYSTGFQREPLSSVRDKFILVGGLSNVLKAHDCYGYLYGTPHSAPNQILLLGGVADCDGNPLSASIDHKVSALLAPPLKPVLVARVHNSQALSASPISFSGPGPGMWVPPSYRPSVLFADLFTSGVDTAELDYVRGRRLSILDFVEADVSELQKKLSRADHARLDLHLQAVRELEKRAALVPRACSVPESRLTIRRTIRPMNSSPSALRS